MSTFLDNVRGTVQGVLAGVGHVIWYVDWHTGGHTVRPRVATQQQPARARSAA